MKPMIQGCGASPVVLMAGLLLIPSILTASPLAYEGFDYATGSGNLTNQNGGFGWGGVWQTVNNGSADVQTNSLAAGASSPTGFDLRSIGRSCVLPTNRRVGRYLDTSASGFFGTRGYRDANGRIGADGKTLYLSFVQQPNGTSSYYEFEFHRGNLGDAGRIGGIGNDQPGTNVNLRAPNATHTVIGAGTTAVNFYVVRIDFKAGNDDVYVYRNPTSLTEPGSATLTRLNAADMSFDGISFGAFNNSRVISHDEVRLGETWEDVVIPPTASPVVTIQPHASTTAYIGTSVVLRAEFSSQPLATYQWFKGTDPISGQTGTTLTLSNLQLTDADDYFLTATNSQGSTTTSAAHVAVTAAPAGLLAYEGFDYPVGNGNMLGKSGGIGWTAPWVNVNGDSGNVTGSLNAGTNAPNGYDAQSTGNASFVPNEQRDGRLLDTTPAGRFGTAGYIDGSGNIGADGKTLYISFLQQPDGTSLFYEFEFHRGNLGDPGRIGGIGNDTGNPIVNLRAPNNTATLVGPGSTGVNLYVVRIDFKAGNDDVYVYQNPLSATEPATATLAKLNAADMSFNGISLAAYVNNRTVKHDEIRLGQSWSDVVFGTSRRQLTWIGDGIANQWNFAANNWNPGSGTTAFVDGDPVTFDDSGSDTPSINVASTVSTASFTAANTARNYTIGGGTINCSGGLAKSGAGSLVLNGTSSFSSSVVVNGGILSLDGSSVLGGGLNANAGTTNLGGNNSLVGMISTNGTVNITGPTTISGSGAFVWMGNLVGAATSITMGTGGTLTMTGALADAWVIGRDGGVGTFTQNDGTVTYNPTNRNEAYFGASTSTATSATYNMNGGTLEMRNKRMVLALGHITSHLNLAGGTINVRQLDLGNSLVSGPGTGIFEMTGGTMNLGAVGLGTSGITSGTGLYTINLGGGTLGALADWSSSLAMTLTGSGGDTSIDTGGQKITLSGVISGSGGLNKIGNGTLLTTGFNVYTGPTTVSAGTLAGNGNYDASAVSVAAGATLSPGNGIGTFNSGGSVTLSGGATLVIQINSQTESADLLSAIGGIELGGATLELQETVTGTIPTNDSLIVVESATGLTGTFAGYPNGATVLLGTNTFAISYTSTQVILTSVGTPYGNWAASKGLDGTAGKDPAFQVDADHDGIANGLEWILGGDPLAQDAASLITSTGNATTGMTLTFNRAEGSIGNAGLIVQWDTDLDGSWSDVPITQAGGSYPNGVTVSVNELPTPDQVTVNIPGSNSVAGKLFARLRSSQP